MNGLEVPCLGVFGASRSVSLAAPLTVPGDSSLRSIPHCVWCKPATGSVMPYRFTKHPAPTRLVSHHRTSQHSVVGHGFRSQAPLSQNSH